MCEAPAIVLLKRFYSLSHLNMIAFRWLIRISNNCKRYVETVPTCDTSLWLWLSRYGAILLANCHIQIQLNHVSLAKLFYWHKPSNVRSKKSFIFISSRTKLILFSKGSINYRRAKEINRKINLSKRYNHCWSNQPLKFIWMDFAAQNI